jgi:hypothetical protein
MKNLWTPLALLAALLLAPLASPAVAGDDEALGTWDIVAQTPQGEMTSVLTLTKAEGALKAEFALEGVTRTVRNEKVEGGVLTMQVMYDGVYYDVEAKLDGDTMEGTWSGGGNSGTLKATRRPAKSGA